ncbi:MAG: GcvT family protein [Proteobacteria bacterium]|nr:GcvT family protein [Pseudomonadota bacterium]
MKSEAQVVVIGGGIVGCSVLYHLTKVGWRDVVLLERSELTSGSTWHAAGGMHTVNGDPNIAKLQKYTIDLYRELERVSGQSCSIHVTGGILLAGTPERLDFLKMTVARGRYLGLNMEMIPVEECKRRFPMLESKYFLGGLYNDHDAHADPWGVTNAYAAVARMQGAEIYKQTRVSALDQRADGTWDVRTENGDIHAEHVVNAGGLWAREVGRMVGIELPVLAMQHHYVITDEIPEVVQSEKEVLHIVDFEGEIYMRQEGRGMLMGTYEQACVPWSERSTPWDYGTELLPPDLDRIAPSLEIGFKHFPALERAGIRKVVNGPFTFAPDGNPLVGPIRGRRNFWVACGVMAGFSQSGGVGLALANWMIHGDPGADVWGMDVARFGEWATMAYTNAKVRENYSRRWRIRFPNEELPAARPLRMTPLYDRLQAERAVFGVSFGLENALWFAPKDMEPVETITFGRSNAHAAVGAECQAVRNAVGVIETATFARYEVTGSGAEAWLSRVMAGRIPEEGRLALTPMLNDKGRLIGDFTIGRLGPERFYLFGSGPAEIYHMRWFEAQLPDRGVAVRPVRHDLLGVSIAGPKARLLLQKLTEDDVSHNAFPFLSFRTLDIGMIPAMVGRISFTGDLGYEIWVTPDYQLALYEAVLGVGSELGIRNFGARALHSMRLEKSFGTWAREYRPIYTPFEAGLQRFLAFGKGAFIGREAALRDRDRDPKLRLITLAIEEAGTDAIGDEPIWHDGKVVGWVTSGGYAHHVGKSVALGYVPSGLAEARDGFEVEIIGNRRRAARVPEPLFDPQGMRMRG